MEQVPNNEASKEMRNKNSEKGAVHDVIEKGLSLLRAAILTTSVISPNLVAAQDAQVSSVPSKAESSDETPPDDWIVKKDVEEARKFLTKQEKLLRYQEDQLKSGEPYTHFLHPFGFQPFVSILVENGILTKEQGDDLKTIPIIILNNEEWELGLVDNSLGARTCGLRKVSDPMVSIQFNYDTSISLEKINELAKQAQKNRDLEKQDAAGMRKGFDIADKNESMAYIHFADESDSTMHELSAGSLNIKYILAQRYNLFMSKESQIDVSEQAHPMETLRNACTDLRKKGIKNFYININLHGDKKWLTYRQKDKTSRTIQPFELRKLFQEFDDCRFTINAVSCYGGGLAGMMKEFKDKPGAAPGRISVFTQVKPDVMGLRSIGPSLEKGTGSSIYNAALSRYLLQGYPGGGEGPKLSYGEAHIQADEFTKKNSTMDAEVHVSQPEEVSDYTADVDPSTEFNSAV